MDLEVKLKNWRASVHQSLLSHPNVVVALLMILTDALVDITLLYTALKTSMPPIWIFLAFLGCQALSSPIQGAISDYFSQKKSIIFALAIGIVSMVLSLELPLDGKIQEASTPISLMTLILCCKGLLGNLTVISRAAIAEVIKVETLEKQ